MTVDITTMRSNALAPLVPPQEQEAASRAAITPFIPAIKLLQATSEEIGLMKPGTTEPRFKTGEFLIGNELFSIGEKFIGVICGRRTHALMMQGKNKIKESFIWESPVFKEIRSTPSNNTTQLFCSWGTGDFLLWLPDYLRFTTLFCGRRALKDAAVIVIDCITPPEQRKTELARERPHTMKFEFSSRFETKAFGPKRKCFVLEATPLQLKQEDTPPEAELLPMYDLFMTPVNAESNLKTSTDAVER